MPEVPELLDTPGVRMLGYLSDDELRTAYANSLVFSWQAAAWQ
jgi:hypothetical protein